MSLWLDRPASGRWVVRLVKGAVVPHDLELVDRRGLLVPIRGSGDERLERGQLLQYSGSGALVRVEMDELARVG